MIKHGDYLRNYRCYILRPSRANRIGQPLLSSVVFLEVAIDFSKKTHKMSIFWWTIKKLLFRCFWCKHKSKFRAIILLRIKLNEIGGLRSLWLNGGKISQFGKKRIGNEMACYFEHDFKLMTLKWLIKYRVNCLLILR